MASMGKYVAPFAKKELGHKELKVNYSATHLKKNNIVGSRFQIFFRNLNFIKVGPSNRNVQVSLNILF